MCLDEARGEPPAGGARDGRGQPQRFSAARNGVHSSHLTFGYNQLHLARGSEVRSARRCCPERRAHPWRKACCQPHRTLPRPQHPRTRGAGGTGGHPPALPVGCERRRAAARGLRGQPGSPTKCLVKSYSYLPCPYGLRMMRRTSPMSLVSALRKASSLTSVAQE